VTDRVRQTDVEMAERTPDWEAYHQLVIAEARCEAPPGTEEELRLDPCRWSAHLGCAIGDLEYRTRYMQRGTPEFDALQYAVRRLTARKGDVVALRRRSEDMRALEDERQRANRLNTALRRIVGLHSGPVAAGEMTPDEALQRAAGIARKAVTGST
jgi:hypothetical protein